VEEEIDLRILLLTQWCDPEPTLKGLVFAKELARRGHDVEILTGFPNYPGGKLYDGYRLKPYQREDIDGIVVHRVPLYPSHDKSGARRVANYASFALSAVMIGPFVIKKPDVIYAYHPPPTIGLPAITLKRVYRAPLVYDIQDMWPDAVRVSGMLTNEKVIGVIDRWCKLIYREADRIVVLSPGFKRLLEERGVPSEKIEIIYNWTFEADMATPRRDPVLELKLDLADRFNVVFAGTMGVSQGLDTVLDAARLVADRVPRAQFVFIGGGVDRERLETRARDEKLDNVRFLPRVAPSQMGPIYAAADVAIVHLVDDPLFRITIPSKVQGYMVAGRPILCGVRGDAAALVEEAGCGLVFPPQDCVALADAVVRLSEMPVEKREELGRNARRFYDEKVSLSAGCAAFERIFETLVKRNADGARRF
jgi:glycosyltransferase involved in cell wall biosynthesis